MRSILEFGIVVALGVGMPGLAGAQAPAPTAAPQLRVGAVIYDTAGAEVGTVDSMTANAVIVSTGTSKVAIPPASFGASANGPVLAATRAQLDAAATAAAAGAKAELAAKLVPGAEVHGTGGTVLGKIKASEGDTVLVETAKGEVRVPAAGFSSGAAGLMLGMSATEFDAAVAAAKPVG
jgi:hypothetical protein